MAQSVYPPLQEAIRAGLFHPGCTHTLGAYIPGLTKPMENTENPEGYEQRQQQRAYERKIRHWKRRAAAARGAGDTDMARVARAKVRDTQEALEAFVDATGRRRKPQREGLMRGKPYATLPQRVGYEPRDTLDKARAWAADHNTPVLSNDHVESAIAVASLLYDGSPSRVMSQQIKDIRERIRGRISRDENDLLLAQNAQNELKANPTWRKIEDVHGEALIVPLSRRDLPPMQTLRGPHEDSPSAFLVNLGFQSYNDRERTPKPGEPLNAHSGLAGVVRAEYGRNLYRLGRLDPKIMNTFLDSIQRDKLRQEITSDVNINEPDQIFGHIFSIITNPHYSPQAYPQWIQSLGRMIFDDLDL